MSVKSDHKGRLTGAEPNTEYIKTIDASGAITYDPVAVKFPDNEKTVSWDEFTKFFGAEPTEVLGSGIQSVLAGWASKPGTLPHVLQVRTYVRDEQGKTQVHRIYIAEKDEEN